MDNFIAQKWRKQGRNALLCTSLRWPQGTLVGSEVTGDPWRRSLCRPGVATAGEPPGPPGASAQLEERALEEIYLGQSPGQRLGNGGGAKGWLMSRQDGARKVEICHVLLPMLRREEGTTSSHHHTHARTVTHTRSTPRVCR